MANVDMWQNRKVREAFIERAKEALAKHEETLRGLHGVVAIEPESGDFFIGKTMGQANQAAFEKYPDYWLYFVRLDDPSAAMPLPTW